MKKTLSLLVLGGMLVFAACGPSEAEKKALEQKVLDSIAKVENEKNALRADSISKAEMQKQIDEANANAAAAKAEASAAKKEATKKTPAEMAKEPVKKEEVPVKKEEAKPANLGKKGDVNKTNEAGTGTQSSPLKKKGSN